MCIHERPSDSPAPPGNSAGRENPIKEKYVHQQDLPVSKETNVNPKKYINIQKIRIYIKENYTYHKSRKTR